MSRTAWRPISYRVRRGTAIPAARFHLEDTSKGAAVGSRKSPIIESRLRVQRQTALRRVTEGRAS